MTLDDYPLTFRRVEKPSEDVCKPLRHVVIAVMLEEEKQKKGVTLQINQIRHKVFKRVRDLIQTGLWNHGFVGHNTIERRINECADPRLWTDGPPPLIHVGEAQSPWYALNPDRFPEEAE